MLLGGHDVMTTITIYNVQRAMTPKVGKPQLRFFCSARRLMAVNISVKFRTNISNGFKLHYFVTDRQRDGCLNSKSRKTTVIVPVSCSSSYGDTYFCETLQNISHSSIYGADTILW